ncbi:MAG: ABC transporter permease [Bacteroidota bacterium]|nr:ABC transporter permease [Bacteroidota bacterium]
MDIIYILWLRQMKRYRRSGLRMVLSVVQPLVYFLTLGFGFNSLFQQAGRGSYIQFVVPGVVAQTILFTSIFWGVNIMWDKQFGFLKETLVAPVSRLKVMLGGSLGGATIAVLQGIVLFIIALLFGFHPYSWSMLLLTLAVMAILSMTMVSFSSGIGAVVNDMQGFMAITNFLVVPLFFLSSALFPLDNIPPVMKAIAYANPLTYAVDAMRGSLINQNHFSLPVDFAVMSGTLILLFYFSIHRFKRIQA